MSPSIIGLTYGYLEPRELINDFASWRYLMFPTNFLNFSFEVFPAGAASFGLNEIGSIKGIQPLTFSVNPQQLLQRASLPNEGFYFFQSSGGARSKSGVLDVAASLYGVLTLKI